MFINNQEYGALAGKLAPKSHLLRDCFNAFWTGGLICVLGQGILNGWKAAGMGETDAGTLTSVCLVFLAVLLTGLAVYDNLAKFAGAGTFVPITGFANSIAAPAVEFKSEGFVLGMAAKMFSLAGPVLVYGISASVLYGIILTIFGQ